MKMPPKSLPKKRKQSTKQSAKQSVKQSVRQSIIGSITDDIRNTRLFSLIGSSFRSWYISWPLIFLSILVDVLFLFLYFGAFWFAFVRIAYHLEFVMQAMGEATGGLMQVYNQTMQVSSGLMGLSQDMEFQQHLTAIFKYIGLFILLVFVLWAVFQGINWYISHMMSTVKKKRQRFLVFWKNFALESIPFYILAVLITFIYIKVLMSVVTSIAPVVSEEAITFIFYFLMLLLLYFSALCFTITTKRAYKNFKQSFIYGIRRFPKTIQSIIFLVFVLVVVFIVLQIIFALTQDHFVLTIFSILLMLPTLVFARILLFKTRQEYWKQSK